MPDDTTAPADARRPRVRRHAYFRRSPAADRALADDYLAGATLVEVCELHGCAMATATKILNELGVKRRPPGRPRTPSASPRTPRGTPTRAALRRRDRNDAILAAFDAREPLDTIAARHGVCRSTVRRVALEAGRETRSPQIKAAQAQQRQRQRRTRMAADATAIIPDNREDQLRHMVSLYDGERWTLEAIGALYGVTRERIRQLIARERTRGPAAPLTRDALSQTRDDPVAIMRAIRNPAARSIGDVARTLGVTPPVVWRVVAALGAAESVDRLFRWRRGSRHRAYYAARREELVRQMQEFAARHGRPPKSKDFQYHVDGLPFPAELTRFFGSYPAAFDAAGLERNGRGYSGWSPESKERRHTRCQRGHDLTEPGARWNHDRGCRQCDAAHRYAVRVSFDPYFKYSHANFHKLNRFSQKQVLYYDIARLLIALQTKRSA